MAMTHWVDRYVGELRDRAKLLDSYGDVRGAQMAEMHAREVEARRVAFDSEEITIEEAALESGYHPERLRELRRKGEWSGCRGDLPRRPKAQAPPAKLADETHAGSIADQINARRTGPRRTG